MKQSEIQEIINTTPDAVFNSSAKYQGEFIITGFVTESRTKYAKPTVYAITQQVYYNGQHKKTTLGSPSKKSLRIITGVFSTSVAAYTAHKNEMHKRREAARKRTEEQVELMNDLIPELRDALKQAGVDNKAYNFGINDTTFKIEVDVDNAEQLLKVLRQFAQVNA